jgi:tetratricopeptide (TPR) repeat protein
MDRRPQATVILEDALEFAPRHLATNERLSGIKLMEARELATVNPQASQEKAREALAIISILLDSRPGAPTLLRSAGQAAELSGVTAQAVDYYKQTFEATNAVSDLAAYASALLTAGRGAEARAALEGDNATLVSGSVFMRALRGRAIAAAGQPDAAANLFKSLLGQSKEPSEQAMIAQQVLRAFASEPERLISLIDSSLGNNVPVQIDLSIASLLMGQRSYDQVIERLKKYVAKPADDFTAQFTILTQIALAYQESDKLEDAKAAYERAYEKMNEKRELVPERQQVQMLNNMAYLLADQLQGYEKDAVRYAKQALALMSDNVSPEEYALIEDTLGWAYFKAGQTEAAIRVLKSSVDKYPLVANRLHLGQAYLDAGDKERAYLVLSAAVDQAKAEGDEKMIAETQKWFKQAS